MFIQSAKIVRFRNINNLSIDFSPGINVLLGDNGQGKTNLIEALYFGSQGYSFRSNEFVSLIKEGCSDCFIEINLIQKSLNYRLKSFLDPKKKILLKDEKKISLKELKKFFSIIDFSPDSLLFVKEGMESRRRLLDEALMQGSTSNIDLIFQQRRLLKSRNKVLKQFSYRNIERKKLDNLLEAINPLYFKLSAELTYRRMELIDAIQSDFTNAMQYLFGKQSNTLCLEYLNAQLNFKNWNSESIQQLMMQRALELKEAEFYKGTSLIGPHRHSVRFLFNGKDARLFCSQGQQRAIILAFKMAQIVYHRKVSGAYPVLMLDDVLSELDLLKQHALLNFLQEINTQIFLTTTDFKFSKNFDLGNVKVMSMNDGTILI